MKEVIEEPLSYLSRKELQLNILKNIEAKILESLVEEEGEIEGNLDIKCWWNNTPNWVKVQCFLNERSEKGGSTSSVQQCLFLGIDPDAKTFFSNNKELVR